MRKKIYFLAALLLLLTACGESQSPIATDGNAYATDGNYVYYAEPFATDGNAYDYSVQGVPYATPGNVEAAKLRTVHVSTVEELLSAIAPETEILLAPGEYNLSQCTPGLYSYCYFHPCYPMDDGEVESELVLCNLYHCIIASESGNCEDVTLIAEPRTAAVLTLEDSSCLQLRGLTLGHTEGAICSGGVLSLKRSGSVYIEDCELYGCGTVGINCESCWGVTARGGLIHDCSYNAIELLSSESILLDGVTFRKCGDRMVLNIMSSHWVEVQNCAFEQNLPLHFLCESWSDHVYFDDCTFTDNSFHSLFSLMNCAPPQLNGCDIPYEQYLRPYENTATGVVAMQDGKEWE